MEYTSVTNPSWVNAEHSEINCNVDFVGVGIVPFTANPLDTSNSSSKQIFDECVAGDYGTIAEYVPPPPYVPTAEINKTTATGLLQATDWTQIPSVSDPSLSNPYLSNKLAFDQYRNDVRQYAVYPVAGNITWPTEPTENWVKV